MLFRSVVTGLHQAEDLFRLEIADQSLHLPQAVSAQDSQNPGGSSPQMETGGVQSVERRHQGFIPAGKPVGLLRHWRADNQELVRRIVAEKTQQLNIPR